MSGTTATAALSSLFFCQGILHSHPIEGRVVHFRPMTPPPVLESQQQQQQQQPQQPSKKRPFSDESEPLEKRFKLA
jgi:hypothetical protein